MTRVLVAGVDTSTQSTKVRITDAATGEQVRFGQAKHPDGTSVNPEFWWEAFTKAAEQAGGLDDVAALAVGGQQHGMVILDKQGNVIRDAMLWNDTSSAPQAAALIDKLGAAPAEGDEPDDVTARGKQRWVKAVGSSPVASYTLTKVAWVAENEPENAKKIAAVCLPHDWLSWRIAGYGRWPRARTLISKPCSPTVPTLPAPFTTMPRMTSTAAISSPWCWPLPRARKPPRPTPTPLCCPPCWAA